MTVSPNVRARLYNQFTECPGCGRTAEDMTTSNYLTIDHLVPRSMGGGSTQDNLLVTCRYCNSRRGDTWPWDWYGAQHMIYAGPHQPGRRSRTLRRQRILARAVAALLQGVDQTPHAMAVAALLGWGPQPVGRNRVRCPAPDEKS